VPLVHDAELVGWLALVAGRPWPEVGKQTANIVGQAHGWAARLQHAKQLETTRQREESVRRSNRLSVAGHMAAAIAHEVRNPLAAIRSTAQLVRDGDVPAEDRGGMLSHVIAQVDRANAVLSDMLGLGRTLPFAPELCDLSDIMTGAADFCDAYAKRRGQRLTSRRLAHVLVYADPREMGQVLVNVLLNACQASPDGAEVSVETSRSVDARLGVRAVARVKDSGPGMDADVLARVFEPFFTTKVDGGGLGLSICRDIVERHEGRIDIDSRPGQGTTVTVSLPTREP